MDFGLGQKGSWRRGGSRKEVEAMVTIVLEASLRGLNLSHDDMDSQMAEKY